MQGTGYSKSAPPPGTGYRVQQVRTPTWYRVQGTASPHLRLRRRGFVLRQDESLPPISTAHREELPISAREPQPKRRKLLLLQPSEAGELAHLGLGLG